MTTPTTTAQTTVVQRLRNHIASLQMSDTPPVVSTLSTLVTLQETLNHIDALTEQVRVLREELRQTDSALAYARDVLEEAGDQTAVRRIDEATHDRDARRALAALEGNGEK